jgi:hypothetical protein
VITVRAELDHFQPKRPYRLPTTPDESLRIRIAWELHGAFRNACYRRGRSMSEVLRELMQAYVDAPDDSPK